MESEKMKNDTLVVDVTQIASIKETNIDLKSRPHFDYQLSKSEHYLCVVTFCLIGFTQLLIWNMFIESSFVMGNQIWPNQKILQTFGGAEHFAALAISILMLKSDGLSINTCLSWSLFNTVLFILIPLIPQFLPGVDNYNTAYWLLMVIIISLGLCSGMLHVSGYAFASILPQNYVGWVSTGNGIAGFFAFTFFLLLHKTMDSEAKPREVFWIYYIVGSLMGALQLLAFFIISRKSWFINSVALAKSRKKENLDIVIKEWGPRRSFWAILKDCLPHASCAAFTLYITLVLFPVCGPRGWTEDTLEVTLMTGLFQTVDLLMRWFPSLGSWTFIPSKYLQLFVILRPVILIPLFVLPYKIPASIGFLSSTAWLYIIMTIFTITNGWFTTLSSIYCTDSVKHPMEKELTAKILVILLMAFVTGGIYTAFVF